MWNCLDEDFPKAHMLNLGFRGATLASCAWYFDRIVLPFEPKSILLYAGDNDLGNERYPEEVLIFFNSLYRW
ncbi:MAG: hypothetical protein HC831_08910 [Chloroflexia bacterium]|nr:hypothetical protein [Chloroflexia bacterium]